MSYLLVAFNCSDCGSDTIVKVFENAPTSEERMEFENLLGGICVTHRLLELDEINGYYQSEE